MKLISLYKPNWQFYHSWHKANYIIRSMQGRRVQICICECIYALIKRLPVGWLYLWGLVSLIVLARFRWIFNAIREKGFLEPKRKGGQRENVAGNTRTYTALQQWEERATVTNSFGATKVAGNLSNGTIKLQLSFFSFFYSRCMYLGG